MFCGYRIVLVGVVLSLTACVQTPQPIPDPPRPAYIISETRGIPPSPQPTPPSRSVVASPEVPRPVTKAADQPIVTPKAIPPTATWIPGHPGFVSSPFGAYGRIDVRGFPPGTEVRDPYTSKIFIVPTP